MPAVYLRSEAPGIHYSMGVNFQKQIGIIMTNVVPFSFDSLQVRVVMQGDEPWFVAVDVCAALDFRNPSDALSRLDDDECKSLKNNSLANTDGLINQRLNPNQPINIINESGLYSLILTSRKPEAKRFKKWVTSEVLPSIRKTGSYTAPQATPTTDAQKLVDTFHCLLKLAHTCGFEKNQALLSADSGTKKLVGTSALSLIDATHLHADQRGRAYTPTELGRMLPIRESGKAFNAKLNLCGLQEHDDAGNWIPTVKAQGLYEWFDTGKRHSDGVPVKQLKWFVSVLDAAKRQLFGEPTQEMNCI